MPLPSTSEKTLHQTRPMTEGVQVIDLDSARPLEDVIRDAMALIGDTLRKRAA
jgi:hypothetical protein